MRKPSYSAWSHRRCKDAGTETHGEPRESQWAGWLDLVPHSGSETKLLCSEEQLMWGGARFSKLVEKVWERGWDEGPWAAGMKAHCP